MKYTKRPLHKNALFSLLTILLTTPYVFAQQSQNLQDILKTALNSDPQIQEAKANVAVAKEQTKITQAAHYPVVSVVDTRMISQRHQEQYDRKESNLGLHSSVNLYSWGAIEAGVKRDKHKQNFYQHKLAETQEQLGAKIGLLYLNALQAKENIAVYRKALLRHQKMLRDVETIASYDEGRASEVVEIQSRLLNMEATISEQERLLKTSLSQLSRYSRNILQAENLVDPFVDFQPSQFIKQYKSADIRNTPSFQAQNEELQSANEDIKVAKAKRLPALNLEGEVNKHGYEVYMGVSWNIFDRAASHSVKQSYHTEEVARAKLENILLEREEQAQTAEVEMYQNVQRFKLLSKQSAAQRKVVANYELQFQIAQRSLIDVLNAYQELTNIEISEVSSRNDFRAAALNYLVSQSKIANWAGIVQLNLPTK